MQLAVTAKLEELLSEYSSQRTANGRTAVVCKDHQLQRQIQTGIGLYRAASERALEHRPTFGNNPMRFSAQSTVLFHER